MTAVPAGHLVDRQQPAAARAEPLVLADLLNDAVTLGRLVAAEVERGSCLDAYLLAAGLWQITEDWLHRDILALRKVAATLRQAGGPGRVAAEAVLALRAIGLRARRVTPGERRTWRFSAELTGVVEGLAGQLAGGLPVAADRAGRVAEDVNRLPDRLRASILRLPSCFRSLDQRPQDLLALVRLLADRLPDPTRPMLVVGIRTSGSYLAPLVAGHLRQLGRRVQVLTLRPGQELFDPERTLVRAAVRDRAAVVVCDDPPDSGRAFAGAAAALEAMGVRGEDLTLLVPLLGPLPESLRSFSTVTLARERWWVERLLQPSSVREALGARLETLRANALRVERLPLEGLDHKIEVGRRGHARALYRLTLADGGERLVYAKGLGLGYFGRHGSAVTGELGEYLPETLAVVDGVLFRRWLPEEARLDRNLPASGPAVADRIAGYVADRAARLPAVHDRSLLLTGRQPLWQRVADRIGGGFGRVRPLVRPALHRLARRLLTAPSPSVVDGSLTLAEWFHAADRGEWVKVDYDERAFSNEDLHVYDAAWDLAVAAADAEMRGAGELAGLLRGSFERRSGRPVEETRWLLYRFQHLAGFAGEMRELLARGGEEPGPALLAQGVALEAAERILLDYLGERLLGDIADEPRGSACAIDVDGVLETAWLGVSSTTPLGALSVRTLLRHGYRPLLATGRSLPEVVDRCRALRLSGGVAEYGAVVYDARGAGTPLELLDESQRRMVERARRVLAGIPGVHIDPRWRRTVRAYRLDVDGRRRAPGPQVAATVLDATDGEVRAVPGWAQTDFVPSRLSKGDGLRAALERIAPDRVDRERPLALAVGDTEPDLPMLAMAERAWAPANADAALRRAGVRIARRRFQAGLAEAVAALVGHRPGGCPACRPPGLGAEDRLLLMALGAQDAGRLGRLAIGWRLHREAGR